MGGAGTLIQNMGTRRNSAARQAEAFEANGASAAVPGRVAPEVSPSLSEVFKPDEAQPVLQEAEKPLPGAVPVMETSPSEGKKAQAVAAANKRKVAKMQAAVMAVEQTAQEEVIPEDPGETPDDLRALMEEEYRNVRQMDAEERENLRPTREVQSGGSAGEPFFSPDGVSTEIPAQQIPESTLFNNRDFPVQNDGAQETEKLPDDQRALRAIEKGDLLPSVRPVTSGGSGSKSPFSANYDKRLFDLSQNHQSAERGNPSGNRDFSVQKIVPAFQSDIKKNLLKAQEVLYLRGGLSSYQRPPTGQHRSTADTSLSMSGTQTISQNSGSDNRDFSVQNNLSQGGGLRKKPRYFEVSAEVRQREAADNARSGAEAIGRVLDPNSGVGIVHAAMHDSRLGMGRAGDIDVVRGEAGDPHRKWAGGYGLAHIIAKHGGDIVPKIADIIAHGELDVIKPKKTGSITRATYSTEDGIVALRHYNDGRTEFFVVTGYEKTKKSNNHSSKI